MTVGYFIPRRLRSGVLLPIFQPTIELQAMRDLRTRAVRGAVVVGCSGELGGVTLRALDQPRVLLVRTDPEPDDTDASLDSKYTMREAHPRGPVTTHALQVKRWM